MNGNEETDGVDATDLDDVKAQIRQFLERALSRPDLDRLDDLIDAIEAQGDVEVDEDGAPPDGALIVKTSAGFAYVRPEHVVAISAADEADCTILMTDGVTITAAEPAEDVLARLEAEAREEDEAAEIKERYQHGHVPHRE